jgi:phosphoserine phosphatase RsbU/P
MTILIADDLETNRKLVRVSLKAEGYDLVDVTNGREALDFLHAATTPVVGLIDWEMPEIDGVEVCRRARERKDAPPLFLILLTIRDNQKDIVRGLSNGANDYVTKPFDYAELLARVKIGVNIVELQQKLLLQNEELRQMLDQVYFLSGFLLVCSYCQKIRDAHDHWEKADAYMSQHSANHFSHGICPDCYKEHIVPQLTELGISVDASQARKS